MDLTVTIILSMICIVTGFLLGILVENLRGEKEEDQPSEPQTSPGSEEITRLWRGWREDEILIEIDDQILQSASELSPDQLQRLKRAVTDLQGWLGILPAKPSYEDAEPGLRPEPDRVPPSPLKPIRGEHTTTQSISPVRGVTSQESTGEARRPNLNPLNVFVQAIQRRTPQEIPTISIVSQINEILQKELEGTPLQSRCVRLMEVPGKAMVVMVGLDKYESVDEVPDEEIRSAIRKAVARWEEQKKGSPNVG